MEKRFMRVIISAAILFVISASPSYSQEKVDWTFSIDRPELPSTGLRFNMNQFQPGFNLGYLPGEHDYWPMPEWAFCFSVNVYYHFAGTSRFTTIRPWYFMTGITFEKDKMVDYDNKNYTDDYTLLNIRAGRELNLNKYVALGLDIGCLYELKSPYDFSEGEPRWSVGFSFNVIIRLQPRHTK